MKKYNFLSAFLFALLLVFMFPIAISASSWAWMSDVRPYHLLPLDIGVASTIEILSLLYIAKVTYKSKAVFFTIFANMVSFAAPYVATFLFEDDGLACLEKNSSYGLLRFAHVGMILIFEWIAVFIPLCDHVESEKRLIWTIFGSNAVSTALVILLESVLAPGQYTV